MRDLAGHPPLGRAADGGGEYGTRVLRIEPKGIEPVGLEERHGSVWSVFTLWFAANVEFATLVTGVLGTAAFGLSFGQAVLAIVLGNLAGAWLLAWMSTYGPRYGVPQMVQSRAAFGYFGSFLPALLNFVSGFSWFAVNTVLGIFALEWLFHLGFAAGLALMVLVQVAVAVFGYNLIHTIERYLVWVLTAIFAAVSVYGFSGANLGGGFDAKLAGPMGFSGAFILTFAIAFSYVLGWVPYASDYTRYLPSSTDPAKVNRNVFLAMFVSGVWLESLGAAIGTVKFVGTPTDLVAHLLPAAVGTVAMVAVVLGTVTANVLNIYSGALSALVVGVPLKRWAAAVVVGAAGTIVSWLAGRHGYWQHYEVFLFLLGYWIAPWLGVMAVDHLYAPPGGRAHLYQDRSHRFGFGFAAWAVSIAASVPFMNQPSSTPGGLGFVGPFAKAHPGWGDVTYFVSFALAAALYWITLRVSRSARSAGAIPGRA